MDKKPYAFFVEGKTDRKFLQLYLQAKFDLEIQDNECHCIGGDDRKLKQKNPNIGIEQDGDKKLLFIVDDDGCRKKKKEEYDNHLQRKYNLNEYKDDDGQKKEQASYDLFFIEGNLEKLLKKIAQHPEFFDCWQKFVKCLTDTNLKFNIDINKKPTDKDMIYSYQDLFPKGNNKKIEIDGF